MSAAHTTTVIDLFCGAGGLSLGFRAAGCRIIAAVDHDETAAKTYDRNLRKLQRDLPPQVFGGDAGDMAGLDIDALPRPDVLVGGPPCQGFSRIGRAKLDSLNDEGFKEDPRNELYLRFLATAQTLRPTAVVMENVPGMLSMGGRNVADEIAADMARRGYRTGYALLNAAWYGVPQFRERIFFIGFRDDLGIEPSAPAPTHMAELPGGYSQPTTQVQLPLFALHRELALDMAKATHAAVTVAQALDDLPRLQTHLEPTRGARGSNLVPLPYRCPPHSPYARLMRRWPGGLTAPALVHDHLIRLTPRDFETFRRMQPGDRYPQALKIARQRRDEELARLRTEGHEPAPASAELEAIERRFIPPYPEDSFVDKWRKLIPDQPSWTVPAHLSKDAYSHIHHDSDQARSISVREAARLQSFPDAFGFEGNMGDAFRQIGNAVPPLLAWAVAAEVLRALGKRFRRAMPVLEG